MDDNFYRLIDALANAIATQEGWFRKTRNLPSITRRLNNPGFMPHWKDRDGAPFPVVNGAVKFPSEELGWAALRAQCKINVLKRGLTFREFFWGKSKVYEGWCPKRDNGKNDPKGYADAVMTFVQHRMGQANVTLDTRILDLIPSEEKAA